MHGQIANLGMFAEEFSGLELVLEDFGKVFDVFAGSGGDAVLFDRMRCLMRASGNGIDSGYRN